MEIPVQSFVTRLLTFTGASLVAVLIFSQTVLAIEVGSGLEAIEDGDDRMRPAALLHVGTTGGLVSRFYLYGRNYGPVQERNYLLSVDKRFDIGGKNWQGLIGIAGLCDTTTLKYDDHPEDNMSFSSTNVGMAFGLHWNIWELKKFQLKATWDAHIFPAGSGFIFLANARKSGLGLTAVTLF